MLEKYYTRSYMLFKTERDRERANPGNKIAESIIALSGPSGFGGSNNFTKCPFAE